MNSLKIVLLDGYTMNPGDMSWDDVEKLGDFTCYDRTPPDKIIERAIDSQLVLTNKTVLDRNILEQLPNLRYIGLLSTGANVVDLGYSRERGIPVTNVPAYSTPSVAQLTFALILEIANRVGYHNDSVARGDWAASVDFCYWHYPLMELAGKKIGLIGYGNIGKQVARIAKAMDMEVLVNRKNPQPDDDITYMSFDELISSSDIISLHCPLTEETKGIISKNQLDKMKKGAILINTGRGGLLVEQDVADALRSRKLAGVGLDVLNQEPPVNGSPLIGLPNCFITPHIAWGTFASRKRLYDTVVNNIKAFLDRQPVNVVN